MDILQNMKEKTIQAANDTMGTNERTAIKSELDALSNEIADIVGDTEFNSTALFSGTGTSFTFQVNAESGDTFVASVASVSASVLSVATTDLLVSSAASAAVTLTNIDGGIQRLADAVSQIGDSQKRLTYKEQNLAVSQNNYESARSRIADADFAREQMEIVKLQILQQTGTAALAQANAAPQSILSLISG
jgi:flagellin